MVDETRNIDLNFQSNADQVQGDVNNLNSAIDKTVASTDNQTSSTTKSTSAFKSNANAVLENGGAMGLLNDLTGGYAMMVKDAVEASALFLGAKKADTVATEAQAVATVEAAVATEGLTVAQKSFNLVAQANPYILLATLLVAAAGATVYFVNKQEESSRQLDKTRNAVNKAAQATKDLGENITESASQATVSNDIEILRAKSLGATTSEIRKLIKAQNDRAVSEAIINNTDAYNNAVKASNAYTNALINGDEELIKSAKSTYEAAQKLSDDAAKAIPVARDNQTKAALQSQIEYNAEVKAINDKARDKAEADSKKAADDKKSKDEADLAALGEFQAIVARTELDQAVLLKQQQQQTLDEGIAADQAALDAKAKASDDYFYNQADAAIKNDKINKELDDLKKQRNEAALNQASSTFAAASELLGKQTAAGKAAAIAEATINTYKAATSAYSSLSGIPIVGPALGAVAAGVAIAAGIANVKKILAVKTPGGGGSAGAGISGGGATVAPGTAPNVSFVSSSENQIANTINRNQTNQAPIKAYVVSSDMTTQQQLDRNLVSKTSV